MSKIPTQLGHGPQKQAFLDGEGDQWFQRNRHALQEGSAFRNLVVQRIAAQLDPTHRARVLEIGCGQGDNLHALTLICDIEGHGIEPSQDAVRAGMARFASLRLRNGTADDLPYPDDSFDVVWFGFCLYLIDRTLLQRSIAEADRLLRDGGLLVIVDFDPDTPRMQPYHHRAGLQSYKMNHSRLFLANPAYVEVEKQSTSHTTGRWTSDPQERIALTLCRKQLTGAYRAF